MNDRDAVFIATIVCLVCTTLLFGCLWSYNLGKRTVYEQILKIEHIDKKEQK